MGAIDVLVDLALVFATLLIKIVFLEDLVIQFNDAVCDIVGFGVVFQSFFPSVHYFEVVISDYLVGNVGPLEKDDRVSTRFATAAALIGFNQLIEEVLNCAQYSSAC